MEAYNNRLKIALKLEGLLKKYIYLTSKIQNEVIHTDTLMLFRQTEKEVNEQLTLLKSEFENY
jgi:hypothetical protein